MARRTSLDGIPRSIVNGKIMKYDWVLPDDLDIDYINQEELEEHIAKLMEAYHE